MNGNLVVNLFAAANPSLDFTTILQTYWYAFVAVPCVLGVALAARNKRRNKTYKW